MTQSPSAGMQTQLATAGYVAEAPLATTLGLLELLQRPLLLEGDAGVGKTALAKALAESENRQLIRLQCYEGLDVDTAVYEWNYPRQLLAVKLQEGTDSSLAEKESEIFSERYLLPRPLMRAITQEESPVLLIDEIDRADEAFEAYLLELLSDFQVSIPEFGTVPARSIPRVILTSNGTRELSDALRRRCLYYFLDYPSADKERAIVAAHLPQIEEQLLRQLVAFVQGLRNLDMRKKPGVAETLDWAAALWGTGKHGLPSAARMLRETLACLVKTREDQQQLDDTKLNELLAEAREA